MNNDPDMNYDIVLFGATSFVGQILTGYLTETCGPGTGIRWAIAGRSKAKLAKVASDVAVEVDQFVVDANDEAALADMCAQTRLVISTVGPYALYGSKLIAAVAEAGTDYCDLTGEPQWMQRMIDAHHDRAVETGARVVHACGFDSVPSDLGLWYLQQESMARFGSHCPAVRMGVKAMKGGASGGTIASMMNLMEEVSADPSLRKTLSNPYALAPVGDRAGVRQPNVTLPEYNEGLSAWEAPFVMAATNTRVVFRTHALLGHPWGEDFTYGESMLTGDGLAGRAKALAMTGGLGAFMGASAVGPLRSVLGRVLPEPGEGPSPQAQAEGFYDMRFHGATAAGESLVVRVTGDRDPGYGSTAKILGQAALTLLESDRPGGFWTPVTALGAPFVDALVAHAGLTFEVLR